VWVGQQQWKLGCTDVGAALCRCCCCPACEEDEQEQQEEPHSRGPALHVCVLLLYWVVRGESAVLRPGAGRVTKHSAATVRRAQMLQYRKDARRGCAFDQRIPAATGASWSGFLQILQSPHSCDGARWQLHNDRGVKFAQGCYGGWRACKAC
jgi:hypothetical protein